QLVGSMVVRLTGEQASSCIVGDWKQVEILKRQFKGSDLIATRPLSYAIDGNKLTLGVTEICDGYVFLHGVLTDTETTVLCIATCASYPRPSMAFPSPRN
ncbi:MAG TPA: hypothetical protein VGI23_20385, partial [Steroidobacteraceae bacterium]